MSKKKVLLYSLYFLVNNGPSQFLYSLIWRVGISSSVSDVDMIGDAGMLYVNAVKFKKCSALKRSVS